MKAEERIRCPVHDLISFKKSRDEDVLLWRLLQEAPVQRLRRIKQLGFSDFVYPGATHSRFSHVVGAMQMARRMLDVLERNDAFSREGIDPAVERRATLAAALIHDVGHGPYSHVFEEVSSKFGIEKKHEAYTLELIDDSSLTAILKEYDVHDKVRRFFTKEPGHSVFNAVISSQLDCDRLDFLCRDRHHTGIRSASIDLSWLFDSLRIEQVPIGDDGQAQAFSFIFAEKGQAAAEEFVIAYMKMYYNVYFHKTTRGMQHVVADMMLEILNNHIDNQEISNLPIVKYFKARGGLGTYLSLDDSSIVTLAQIACLNDWGLATELARRFLFRVPYKSFEVPSTGTKAVPRIKLTKFREALKESGIYAIEDIISHRNYKQHDVTDTNFLKNILIKKDGEPES
jgi:uncharacterized protein